MCDPCVFISHCSSTPFDLPEWLQRYAVEIEVKLAVRNYLNSVNSPGPSRWIIEHCIIACRTLDNLSDEDWDALAPQLVEEIEVLHNAKVPAWWLDENTSIDHD